MRPFSQQQIHPETTSQAQAQHIIFSRFLLNLPNSHMLPLQYSFEILLDFGQCNLIPDLRNPIIC